MTPHDRALELLKLAEHDEHAAHVLQADSLVDPATIGFHYQQAAEKLLKAMLADKNIEFPRTHDLARLIELVESAGWSIAVSGDDLERLTPFAVTGRYQLGEEGGSLDQDRVRAVIEALHEWVRAELAP